MALKALKVEQVPRGTPVLPVKPERRSVSNSKPTDALEENASWLLKSVFNDPRWE